MKKAVILIAVCALVLVSALIVYHIPRTIRWTGEAESSVNGISAVSYVEIDVKMRPKLFRSPVFTGSVTVDGERYEDITAHEWVESNLFVPLSLKEDMAGKQLEIFRDYLTLSGEGDRLTVLLYSAGTAGEGYTLLFEIPLK